MDVSRGDIVSGTAPFDNATAPAVTVRAKVSSSSIAKTASWSTAKIHASPSIQRSRSPVRSAPVSRPISALSSPSTVPHVRVALNGSEVSASAPNLGFVPKAKKSTISLATTSGASTSPAKFPVSGSTVQKSHPITGRGVLTPSSSNASTPRMLSPAARSRHQARSPTPTSRVREQARPRTGSMSGDIRKPHIDYKHSSSNLDRAIDSRHPKPDDGAFNPSNNSLPPNGNNPPVRLRAKLSNITIPASTPATPQRSPDGPNVLYCTPRSSPPTTSITKPSPTVYTPSDSLLAENSASPRRRVSLSSTPSSTRDTTLGHSRTSSGVYNSRIPPDRAALSPLAAVKVFPDVHGDDANDRASGMVPPRDVHTQWLHQRTRVMTAGHNDATIPRSPVSSTLSSSSVNSGRKRSDSQSGHPLKLFPFGHSRSGSEASCSIMSSPSISSGKTTSMINGAPVRATRSVVFPATISSRDDEINLAVDHESETTGSERIRELGDGAGTSDCFEADKARSEALAAKSSRKIADLEITNNSLLAINATLEAEKHRLSKEVRDLRRRLRRQRLSLPPQAYRALVRHEQRAAALSPPAPGEHPASTEALPLAADQINIFADEDEDLDDDEDEDVLQQYERVTALVDALLFHATKALSAPATPDSPPSPLGATHLSAQPSEGDLPTSNVGLKVLSPKEVEEHYELRRRRELGLEEDIAIHHDDDVSVDSSIDGASSASRDAAPDPALVPLPDTSDLTDSSVS